MNEIRGERILLLHNVRLSAQKKRVFSTYTERTNLAYSLVFIVEKTLVHFG